MKLFLLSAALTGLVVRGDAGASTSMDFDVLVYGATSGGVMAAVAAVRNGAGRVGLLDPGQRIGGMTASTDP